MYRMVRDSGDLLDRTSIGIEHGFESPYPKAPHRSIDSLRPCSRRDNSPHPDVLRRPANTSTAALNPRTVHHRPVSSEPYLRRRERHDGCLRGCRNQRSSFGELRGISRLSPVDDTVESFGSRYGSCLLRIQNVASARCPGDLARRSRAGPRLHPGVPNSYPRTDQRRDPRARVGCQAWPALRGCSIGLVIIQSPAINAVTRLGDPTGECPALAIGVIRSSVGRDVVKAMGSKR